MTFSTSVELNVLVRYLEPSQENVPVALFHTRNHFLLKFFFQKEQSLGFCFEINGVLIEQ